MSNDIKKITRRQPVQDSIDWLNSPEGKKNFEEALKRVARFSEEFKRSCECDPEILSAPMTI